MTVIGTPKKSSTNQQLAYHVIEEAVHHGVQEFYLCPGARCAPLLHMLKSQEQLTISYGFEERSIAFYALGRARQTNRPVAIVTTSGTAVGELMPAMMEAYYTGTPLLVISADRPRRFRGTAAPQAAEQVGLFGMYTPCSWDVAGDERLSLKKWSCHTPAHVNVCFEEPLTNCTPQPHQVLKPNQYRPKSLPLPSPDKLHAFFDQAQFPWIIVGGLHEEERESVVTFLLRIQAPVYLEAPSGLREDPRLASIQIRCIENVWERATHAGYPIDAVFRIGSVPTLRPWRDMEEKQHTLAVLSISSLPFSGLSWGNHIQTPIAPFLDACTSPTSFSPTEWVAKDQQAHMDLLTLFDEEPFAEPSLIHQLSKQLPNHSHVYLGNSSPIREWDLAADTKKQHPHITASRGLNGIDGQISQFLGLSNPKQSNWAILGDLTTLYDMAGPWVLESQKELSVNIVVINNGGGQIFARMFREKEFLNSHQKVFKPLADLWGFHYTLWQQGALPNQTPHQLIEVTPDPLATQRFWDRLNEMRRV